MSKKEFQHITEGCWNALFHYVFTAKIGLFDYLPNN